jgi:hypothetical protein
MGGINPSDTMLYTYLLERRIVRYWKKVAFNIIARMVLNNCILYKGNYRGPGKLKSRYNLGGRVVGAEEHRWSR